MLFQKAKALPTATRGSPEHLDRSGLANLRLNLHETLTSRVATKSDIHWLPPPKQRSHQTQQRGANAKFTHGTESETRLRAHHSSS